MKEIIGVIHLKPLPGSPRAWERFEDILNFALNDAENYLKGGINTVIVENFGDAPFSCGAVDPHTAAYMTHAILKIKEKFPDLKIGVNVLRNDGKAAIGIAAATGAGFVRINVLTYAMVTDCGIIEGNAREINMYRKLLNPEIKVYADILVKHAFPLNEYHPVQVAKDTALRGGADAIILTGESTGATADVKLLHILKEELRNTRILIGSGVSIENIVEYKEADGFIIGTSLKKYSLVDNPVDPGRVKQIVEAIKSL